MTRRREPARWVAGSLAGVMLAFFALFFALPVAWLVLAPTKSTGQLNGLHGEHPFSFGSFEQLADNWSRLMAFQNGIIVTWLGNSVLYAGPALVLTLVATIPAGYALAMTNFRFRRVLLVATLMVMLIPNTALVLPIFLEIASVHLVGTPLAVILPFSFFPFGVYLTYIYFSTSISHDLLDAARMDGAGELRVFRSIALPLATPVVALVGFFSLVANWNNYFMPFVMQSGSRRMPIQVGLTELLTSPISNPQLALATLLGIAPVLAIFLFSQRFLVSGSTAGGTKE
jgi:multiple sugar transport system permease protein